MLTTAALSTRNKPLSQSFSLKDELQHVRGSCHAVWAFKCIGERARREGERYQLNDQNTLEVKRLTV